MSARASRPQVLVVDDDSAVRAALAFWLDLQGFDVATYPSGEALLAGELPMAGACLVLDERLPGLSGLETLLRLRARDVTLPAILVSSDPKAPLRAAAAATRSAIVEKPLINDALTAAIREALAV